MYIIKYSKLHSILTLELIERHEQEKMHRITGTEKVSRNKSLVAETSNLKLGSHTYFKNSITFLNHDIIESLKNSNEKLFF